jgi:hypothetical protein
MISSLIFRLFMSLTVAAYEVLIYFDGHWQGDQIGRIFAYWANVNVLWAVF